MTLTPINLSDALASFDDIYSPRIVGRVNDYTVRIAHAKGDHVWHVHEHTDEFFLVLDGLFEVSLRDADGAERTVTLRQGDIFVVPKGTEHRPTSGPGASILMFEPQDTSTTGDRHEGDIPDHVDSTTGHELLSAAGRASAVAGSSARHGRRPGGDAGPPSTPARWGHKAQNVRRCRDCEDCAHGGPELRTAMSAMIGAGPRGGPGSLSGHSGHTMRAGGAGKNRPPRERAPRCGASRRRSVALADAEVPR